jgi:hypothetical protein
LNNIEQQITPENTENMFVCKKCNKNYKARNSLWYHEKKCNINTIENNDSFQQNIIEKSQELPETEKSDKELIILLLKQNNDLQNKVIEICKNASINNSHNNNITNSHNKAFNLNFFLNETCKDALNIQDFVSSIKMDLDDLEKTGLLGYAEGISNIINKNLNGLDQTMRPIHCSDVKREVFYVKNDDQWVKENDAKPVLTKAIKQVAHENIRQISEWQKKYPDCCDPDSTKNDTYLNIVSNAMSGLTSEEQMKNYEKIISNVAKEVIIEKV